MIVLQFLRQVAPLLLLPMPFSGSHGRSYAGYQIDREYSKGQFPKLAPFV